MDVEILCQFGCRVFAANGEQRHFRFEGRRVVPARTSCHELLLLKALFAFDGAKSSLRRLSHYPVTSVNFSSVSVSRPCVAAGLSGWGLP